MKKSALFILLFSFFATTISLNAINPETDYIRKLESISTEGDVVNITLSDGLVFEWKPRDYEKEMLTEWEKGDNITLGIFERNHSLYLINDDIDLFYNPFVNLKEECVQKLLTIEKMVKSRSEYGNHYELDISLSDGSYWQIGFIDDKNDELFISWNRGDRVIIDDVERIIIDGEDYFIGFMINYSLVGSDDVGHAIQVVWAQ